MKKYNHKSIFQNVVFSMLVFLCGFKDCLGILDQVNHGMPNIDMTVNDLTNIKSDHDRDLISSSSSAATRNLVLVDDAPRQTDVWEMINTMDSYKLPPSYTQSNNDRPTLTKVRYLVQPTWWRNLDQNDPSLLMDVNAIDSAMSEAAQYYLDMSWGKMEITYEILPQRKLDISSWKPKLYGVKRAVENAVANQGYVEGVDYDAIIFLYHPARRGDLKDSTGAKGQTNGNFIWAGVDSISYKIFRHEIGHNIGHDHHGRNEYKYRNTRPWILGTSDGFDMMSGGNPYEIADLHVASKWFYNWVEDSSIIKMQPEGSTTECPSCLSSGTFTIKPFDMRNVAPSSTDKLGIHIPIAKTFDKYYENDFLFSYWISYRSGVDGLASEGVQIHFTMFELFGQFGSYFDSMIYDAYGDTDDKLDSFVVKDSCYRISPTAYMKDRDIISAEAVQPVICVDNINPGNDVTVSVSFINQNSPPSSVTDVVDQPVIQCTPNAVSFSTSIDGSKFNLFHFSSLGSEAIITASLQSVNAGSSEAYFYDEYPSSPIDFNSDPGYGSFASIASNGSTSTYKTVFGQAWILVPPSNDSVGSPVLSYSCRQTQCLANHYLSPSGSCTQCPSNSLSDIGSTSIDDCKRCPAGTYLPHPLASNCHVSENFNEVEQAKGWRLWTPGSHSTTGWSWEVMNVSFYSDMSCQTLISPSGLPIDSANAGFNYRADNAFGIDNGDTWGGRLDDDETLWIGMMFDLAIGVKCIEVKSYNDHVHDIRVQAYNEIKNEWENAWIQDSMDTSNVISTNTIRLNYGGGAFPTKSPTMSPTMSPTKSPTMSPTMSPTKSPTMSPTTALTSAPTSAIVQAQTPAPTAIVQTNCVEVPSNRYFVKVKSNGKVMTKTCRFLSLRTAAQITRICRKLTQSNEQFDRPKVACPVTCGCDKNNNASVPTQSPTSTIVQAETSAPTSAIVQAETSAPTSAIVQAQTPAPTASVQTNCVEVPSNRYFVKVKSNGKVMTKTCRFLSSRTAAQITRICRKLTQSNEQFDRPKVACPVTCGCDTI